MSSQHSNQACSPCRRLKRKCPRELPSCSLCDRLSKPCEYPTRRMNYRSTPGDTNAQSVERLNKLSENSLVPNRKRNTEKSPESGLAPSGLSLTARDIQRVEFPVLFFLDSMTYRARSLSAQVPALPVPAEMLNMLGSIDAIHSLCGIYLHTIHTWLPIISQKIIYRRVNDFNASADIGLGLLMLCMKLVSEVPSDEELPLESSLYRVAKELCSRVEHSCLVSLQLLQSVVLISVFEIGHGIYPAAYLSIGHAARLGYMMGLHNKKNATHLFKEADTWSQCEEERRTWWAVLILERYVNLGTSGLPLATSEPLQGALLPCAEFSWDRGEIGSNEPLFVSSFSATTDIGSYATVCQACHILGLVLRHRDNHNGIMDPHLRLSEALQLHQTLVSLNLHIDHINPFGISVAGIDNSIDIAAALCYSARIILYNLYACNDHYSTDRPRISQESEMQRASIDGLKETTKNVHGLAEHILSTAKMMHDVLFTKSPVLLHCLYEAATEIAWFIREGDDVEGVVALKAIVEVLKAIALRWHVGREYLKSLEIEGYLAYIL